MRPGIGWSDEPMNLVINSSKENTGGMYIGDIRSTEDLEVLK